MGVTRILDLMVLVLLATVLLMPRPDASVKPALTLDPERRARVAELQSTLVGRPDAVDASVELANIFLDGHRPDWALATVTAAAKAHPNDYRVHYLALFHLSIGRCLLYRSFDDIPYFRIPFG